MSKSMYLLLTSRKANFITESMLCRRTCSAYKGLWFILAAR